MIRIRFMLMSAALVMTLLVSVVGLTGCSKKSEPDSSTTSLQKKEIWTCPMHPQIKKDAPGQCPICGMDLVKAGDAPKSSQEQDGQSPSGHASFQLSPARRQMIGVKTGVVKRIALFKNVEAAGRVAFDPELYTAQTEYIESIRQLERVKESPLADVLHSAQRMAESAKLRLKILGLSDRQIQAIRDSGNSGPSLLIPKPGENLWIYAEVYEMDLPSLQPGLEAVISGGSLSGKSLTGKVVSVDRVINPVTRTAKARISAPEAKGVLRPESYVDVVIKSPLGTHLAVPFDAVFDTGKETWVFVSGDNGQVFPRKITIQTRSDEWIAVGSGLEEGEKIITSANFLIDSESRLKGALLDDSNGAEETGPKRASPECPKGQFWHVEMKHCMPKAGE